MKNFNKFNIGSQSDSQSPEMIGIICAILSFCFLCIFALVWILCIYHRRKIANEDNKKTKIKKDIDTLMKLTFTKFSEIQNVFNTRECAIWLEVFQSDSEVTQFKIWHHIFHKEWMLSFYSMNLVDTVKSKCPLCKADINSENNFI